MKHAAVLALLVALAPAARGQVPQLVSPGEEEHLATVPGPCPTFSWASVAGAEGFELAVFLTADEGIDPEMALYRRLPEGATAWTPAVED